MTTLLALDASTTAVGWCLSKDGRYLDSGVYVPDGKDWVTRILVIEDWLYAFDWQAVRPDTIAFEVATGNRGNMATHRKLGAVEYAIRSIAIIEYQADVIAVSASQVRASGCHKHALPVALAIVRELPARPDRSLSPGHEDDEADAIGCYLAAWSILAKAGMKQEVMT